MVAILLSALFTGSALLAISAIVLNWQRYGGLALAVRNELAESSDRREMSVRVREVRVRTTATVLRPTFGFKEAALRSSPADLPAAA